MMMLGKVAIFVLLASLPMQAQANAFLGRSPEDAHSEKASADMQAALLGELEGVLGSDHRTFTERRLSKIQDIVSTIYQSMPKNEHGKLGHGAVSYILHRLFVQRHAWFIKGLEPGGNGEAAWNQTSPLTLFVDKVPEFVQSTFEKRFGENSSQGVGMHEIAVMAATLEHLVHKEAIDRLKLAYEVHQYTPEDVVSSAEAPEVLDTYMVDYILGFWLPENKTVQDIKSVRDKIGEIYPTWTDTQRFIREVMESVAPQRDYLYFSDVSTVIEEAGERYGRWQDHECRTLKQTLLEVEDTGPGGAGRVRAADFYKLALHEGKWQFSESIPYLRQLGALDESEPSNPRIIVTNYIYSPSNCVASSSYYSVCCIDECEGLLAHLERELVKPDARPSEIAAIVSSLSSPTQQNRTLSAWLLQQLDNVAAHHGGLVPLHGRLFSQWMHFAYPRECPYPHVSGTTDPQRFYDNSKDTEFYSVTKEEMQHHLDSVPARIPEIQNASVHEELMMLSMEEELVVWRPPAEPRAASSLSTSSLLRGSAFVAAVVATTVGLMKSFSAGSVSLVGGSTPEKYFV
mmetsp:Transcript_119966/g.195193  ORF Transcript_119966/g.195193 Transcript_119966/m.195193 type:complete len:571 (+) Transcript_119966:80-1792(+)